MAVLAYRGGPANYSDVTDEKLIPQTPVLVNLKPEVVTSEQAMPFDELEVTGLRR